VLMCNPLTAGGRKTSEPRRESKIQFRQKKINRDPIKKDLRRTAGAQGGKKKKKKKRESD